MILRELIQELEILAPPDYAMSWDNSGLLVGHPDSEIRTIYIALDASSHAVNCAAAEGCDLMVTHHPLIFTPIRRLTDDDFVSKRLLLLAENHISLYAMHTNFDTAVMGEIVAEKIGQQIDVPLEPVTEEEDRILGIGSIGDLEQTMTLKELALRIKEAFSLPDVRFFGNPETEVTRAAICPGSGKSMSDAAVRSGCDVLITGDIDHHEGIDSVEKGICVVDAGHHGLEHIFVDYMTDWMKMHHPEIRVIKDVNQSPFSVV